MPNADLVSSAFGKYPKSVTKFLITDERIEMEDNSSSVILGECFCKKIGK
jgi:hypothetical protein